VRARHQVVHLGRPGCVHRHLLISPGGTPRRAPASSGRRAGPRPRSRGP
jgi:hypothetical protein